MLRTLQNWLDKFELDPEKTSLRTLLPAINVTLVLLVIIGISISAVGLLRRLADEQGLSQVQLAGASAQEELRKLSEDALKQARNMAHDPTLKRFMAENAVELRPLLKRACNAAGMDSCALARGEQLLAHVDVQLGAGTEAQFTDQDWSTILTAAREQGERFSVVPSALLPAVMGASAVMLPDSLDAAQTIRVYALRHFDDRLAARLSERTGLKLRLINYRAFSKAPSDDYTRLNSAALSDGRYAAERINARDLFVASVPVFASTGEAIALILAELPTDDSDANIRSLTHRLLITAVLVGALAILVSLLLGQLVARPVHALTHAATRLAQGDFSTSIPANGPAEIGVLARTMEDMRRNLVELTGTLRRREAEAQAVLSGTIEGVFAVDKLRHITYLNPQGARMLGLKTDEAIGRFCGDVLKPCTDKLGNRPCDSQCPILQARTASSAQATERLQIGDGRIVNAVITSAGLVDGLQVQVLRDETELEAIRRARDSVLANISHEFRTPLASQLASIELLLDGLEHMSVQQTRELVLSLERSTQRLTALIDNLLESVRIESGQLGIRQQNVALHDVITAAQALVGALLTQRGQQLQIQVPVTLPDVAGDEMRLTQVLVNLLANACKYAPENSVVRVGAELQGEQICVWVEDEGPGVPDAQLGSIFDRFSRGPEQEPEPGGLGLGLWIVKSIVERHGGQIRAARTADQRTRFSFRLPVSGQ
ncbi:MAG: ATP-binding protein [Steroidobacteraceae bacterium]